jgi:phenylalanyl-tRNA synthetase beta chain
VDVSIEEDLVEEIVRARGYDTIPETLPSIALHTPAEPPEARALGRIRAALEGAGFSEAVNFSFVPEADLTPLGSAGAKPAAIALANPISAELAVMRTSLVPSLLRNAARNRAQRVEDLRLYEIARSYHAHSAGAVQSEPFREVTRVSGVLLGRRAPVAWSAGVEPVDFYDAKAAVTAVLEALGVAAARWEAPGGAWMHPRHSARVLGVGDTAIGLVGEIHPRVAAAFDLPRGVLAFELELEALLRGGRLVPEYRPVPHLPAVLRDLAVVVDEAVQAEAVLAVVRGEPLVESATLFDVYRGTPLPPGRKNLALALRYRAADRTLTDVEVDGAHARIVERLRADPGVRAELRA